MWNYGSGSVSGSANYVLIVISKMIATFPCGHKSVINREDTPLNLYRYMFHRFSPDACDKPKARPHLIQVFGSNFTTEENRHLRQVRYMVHPVQGKVTINGEYQCLKK